MTVFYQDIIKHLRLIFGKMLVERKLMGIIGSIGSAVGSAAGRVAGGVGRSGFGVGKGSAVGVGGGPEFGGGIKGGAASVSGLARFDMNPAFGAAPFVAKSDLVVARPIINEGPANLLGGFKTLGRSDLPVPDLGGTFKPTFGLVNEGPVASLAGLRPLGRRDLTAPDLGGIFKPAAELKLTQIVKGFNPAGEILFNTKPKLDIKALHNDKRVEPMIRPFAVPKIGPRILEFPRPQVGVTPALEPAVKTELQTITEPVVEVKQDTLVQPALEEQVVEKVATERVTAKQLDIVEEKKTVKEEKFVVDKLTLFHRLEEVVQAVRQARSEAKRLGLGNKIVGWIVDKFLSLSHKGDISRIVQPEGPDGTIPLTKQEIRATTEFKSIEEVQTAVLKNVPVDRKEEGEEVTEEQVSKVRQDLIGESSRSGQPVEVVVKRIVEKKQKPVQQLIFIVAKSDLAVANKRTEPKTGHTLKDLNLEEVFIPKAA